MLKRQHLLLTGATGALGSELALRLAARGHKLTCLVRGNDANHARKRLVDKVGKFANRPNVTVIAGDINEPMCGLEHDEITQLGRIDAVVHSAASLSFDDYHTDETFHTNVEGTRHVLDVVDVLGGAAVHYVSTAYVAGDKKHFAEHDTYGTPRNPYEHSKQMAESLVRERTRGQANIYRPSIMVGNQKDYRTTTFDGYYGFFKPLSQLADKTRAKQQLSPSDEVELLIHLSCSDSATLNLVPTDWVTDAMTELVLVGASGQVYHLTHPNPPRVKWVIETSLAHLRISGVTAGEARPNSGPSSLQNLVDKNLGRFAPYVHFGQKFSGTTLTQMLGTAYSAPRAFDEEFLQYLLGYAVFVWQSKSRSFAEA